MANATRNLALTGAAYIKQSNPGTHYTPAAGDAYRVSMDASSGAANRMLYSFASWPSSLKRNRLLSARIRVRVKYGMGDLEVSSITQSFNASTVTWNNRPAIEFGPFTDPTGGSSASGTADIWITLEHSSAPGVYEDTRDLLHTYGIALQDNDYYPSEWYPEDYLWYAYSGLGAGGNAYIQVTYDDTNLVKSKVVLNDVTGWVNPLAANSFTWKYERAGDYRCYDETWTQASAK